MDNRLSIDIGIKKEVIWPLSNGLIRSEAEDPGRKERRVID